jgi:hypothetical protein
MVILLKKMKNGWRAFFPSFRYPPDKGLSMKVPASFLSGMLGT